jgi:hypothetical protein
MKSLILNAGAMMRAIDGLDAVENQPSAKLQNKGDNGLLDKLKKLFGGS